MKKVWAFAKKYKTYIFLVLIIILALKVFVPQLDSLKESVQALKGANKTWVLAAIVVFFSGVPVLAWQYLELALKPIKFWLTWRVQMAGLFVSKLLPSSLGTITLNMYYFTKQNHTPVQATTVMAMNGLTSGIAYGILILIAIISAGASAFTGQVDSTDLPIKLIIGIVIALIVIGFILYKIPKINAVIKKYAGQLVRDLKDYRKHPRAVYMGILLNGIGSATSLFALFASAHAVGVNISLAEALLAYTFGNIAAGLVPTPGGLGAAEAGIYAGLVVVGVDTTSAVTITLLYRLISYWLPILPGYYYFWSLRKNVLSSFSLKTKQKEPVV